MGDQGGGQRTSGTEKIARELRPDMQVAWGLGPKRIQRRIMGRGELGCRVLGAVLRSLRLAHEDPRETQKVLAWIKSTSVEASSQHPGNFYNAGGWATTLRLLQQTSRGNLD